MYPIFDEFPLQDLEELVNEPLDPVFVDPTVVSSSMAGRMYIRDITPLGSMPRVTEGYPVWFNELVEFVDYISPILPRRFENA